MPTQIHREILFSEWIRKNWKNVNCQFFLNSQQDALIIQI